MPDRSRLLQFVARRDHWLMQRLSRWSPPRPVRVWMLSSSRAGDGWLWALLAAPILWFDGQDRYQVLAALALAAASGIGLFLTLKRTVDRERPASITPFGWVGQLPPDRFSFPSGHSLTAFAMTVPLSLFYPAFMYCFLFCALSVAVSRLVLGMHFLSDVVAGSMMGAGIGYAAYSLLA